MNIRIKELREYFVPLVSKLRLQEHIFPVLNAELMSRRMS